MSPAEIRAREAICRVGASLFKRGYAHATAGNLSVRLPDGGLLITPTDACLGRLDPARLARLDAQGQQVDGDRASKTWVLHRQIYAAATRFDADTACVIHTHSQHAVQASLRAVASAPELLPALTPYFVMKVGHVPLIPYHRPGDPAAAAQVFEAIHQWGEAGRPIRAVMLARLGPNVWHTDPDSASAVLEELEETARLWCACPHTPPLEESQIEVLRQQFGARW